MMNAYLAIKQLHVATVVLSGALFVLRGLWMLTDSPQLHRRWVRIVPHVNDTLLLLSAIALAILLNQYPFVNDWLTAKVLGLVVYIALGMVALHRGKTKTIRAGAWIAALVVFAYIVAVAVYHTPFPFTS